MSIFSLNIIELLRAVGYVGMFVMIFAESGLFFGFFLPGGSLLFTAGLLASQGVFNIYWLIFLLGAAAILGDSTGYWFGAKVGDKIFVKEDSLFFNKKYLEKTKHYYDQYGPMTIVIGRFVPFVRTFAPILAGVGKMSYRKFLLFNVLGALLWAVGVSLLGYFLGSVVPGIDKYISLIVVSIVILTLLPILFKLKFKKKV